MLRRILTSIFRRRCSTKMDDVDNELLFACHVAGFLETQCEIRYPDFLPEMSQCEYMTIKLVQSGLKTMFQVGHIESLYEDSVTKSPLYYLC